MSGRKDICRFVVVGVLSVFVSTGGAIAGTNQQNGDRGEVGNKSGLRHDLAKDFGFAWETVLLSARLQNATKGDVAGSSIPSYELAISVGLDIRDTNDLVGMAVGNARILKVLDGDGRDVRCVSDPSKPIRQHVEVGYVRVVENWTVVDKLQPWEMPIRLRLAPDSTVPSVLSQIRGYVYALYAEDVIEVDIPFEPVGQWVEVAPDLEIQVGPSTPPPPGPVEYEPGPRLGPYRPTAPLALYKYETCVRSKTGGPVRGLGDPLEDEQVFGPYVAIRTALYDSGDPLLCRFENQEVRGEKRWGIGTCRAYCRGEMRQDSNSYDRVRHVIAVNPREVKIPFTLTNVPVPSLSATR